MKIKKLYLWCWAVYVLNWGCVGIVLSILPTVPFFLVTVVCFANLSEKLHNWLVSTKIYKNILSHLKRKRV
ncbi:MAG: YbaN family protein [Eubacterium sp.]|nr:YbaN family protein [Eubacterium sp.]